MPSVSIQTIGLYNALTSPQTPLEPGIDSMESSTATLIDDYFLPDDEYRDKMEGAVSPAIEFFCKRQGGMLEPVKPIIISVQSATIAANTIEVVSSRQDAQRRALTRPLSEFVPSWVDNMENHVYRPFHWICRLVRPPMRGACMACGWLTSRFIFGVNLGFLNFRSAT